MTLPWAKCIRRLPNGDDRVYLTFDDGPDPEFTPRVLDELAKHNAHATFFLIGRKAAAHRDIVERILSEGHAIGNHSIDHNTLQYFNTLHGLQRWLSRSEQYLSDQLGARSVGFRSPAGIRTPWLHVALARLQLPWLHWSMRFYDTTVTWNQERSMAGAQRLRSGDIVLLHDTQKSTRQACFLDSLQLFIKTGQERGFTFAAIPNRD